MMSLCHAPIRQDNGNPVRENKLTGIIMFIICKYDSGSVVNIRRCECAPVSVNVCN